MLEFILHARHDTAGEKPPTAERTGRRGPVAGRKRASFTRSGPVRVRTTVHYRGRVFAARCVDRDESDPSPAPDRNLGVVRTRCVHTCVLRNRFPPRRAHLRVHIVVRGIASRFGHRRRRVVINNAAVGRAECRVALLLCCGVYRSLSQSHSIFSIGIPSSVKRRPPAAPGVARKPRTRRAHNARQVCVVVNLRKSAGWASGRFVSGLLDLRPAAGRPHFRILYLFHVPCVRARMHARVCVCTLFCHGHGRPEWSPLSALLFDPHEHRFRIADHLDAHSHRVCGYDSKTDTASVRYRARDFFLLPGKNRIKFWKRVSPVTRIDIKLLWSNEI